VVRVTGVAHNCKTKSNKRYIFAIVDFIYKLITDILLKGFLSFMCVKVNLGSTCPTHRLSTGEHEGWGLN
jgi:hypothetical protein